MSRLSAGDPELGRRSGGTLIAIMEAADFGDGADTPGRDRLDLTLAGAVVMETLVGPRDVVVREAEAKQVAQVAFVEDDDEIEAFATDRADGAFGEGILP